MPVLLKALLIFCITNKCLGQPGGLFNADSNDSDVKDIAQFVLDRLNEKSNELHSHTLTDVITAHKQVVAGTNYYLTLGVSLSCDSEEAETDCRPRNRVCQAVVWDRPWLKKRQLLDAKTACVDKEEKTMIPDMLDGLHPEDPEDENIQLLAKFGLEEDHSKNGKPQRSLVNVLEAKSSSHVSSSKDAWRQFYLTVRVAVSKEGEDMSHFEVCEMEVLENEEVKELQGPVVCFPLDSEDNHHMVSESEEMQKVAESVVTHLNNLSPSKFWATVAEFPKTEKKVTPGSGGTETKFSLKMVPTFCLKKLYKQSLSQTCNVDSNRQEYVCVVSAWTRPWKSDILYSIPLCQLNKDSEKVDRPMRIPDLEDVPVTDRVPVNEEIIVPVNTGLCLGCARDVSVDDPKIKEIADFAIESFDSGSNDVYMNNIVSIVRAQTQVVAGIKYIITLQLAKTTCLKESGKDRKECEIDDKEEIKTCEIQIIEQPWRNSRNFYSSNCTSETSSDLTEKPTGSSHDVDKEIVIPDASSESSEEDESNEEDASKEQDLGDMEGAESRNYNDVLEQTSDRTRRNHNIGGSRPVEEKDNELVEKLVNFALSKLDEVDEDDKKRVPLQILEAKKQVVSGYMYEVRVLVGISDCKEGEEMQENCKKNVEEQQFLCKLRILHQPWEEQQMKVVQSECNPIKGSTNNTSHRSRSTRSVLVGGSSIANTSDPYVQKLAGVALAHINAQSNALYSQELVQITKATTQVVAGVQATLTLDVGYTKCRKSRPKSGDCPVDESMDHETCEVTIWDRPWLNDTQITKSTCTRNKKRDTRASPLIGGDDHDVAHLGMFREFMTKYNKEYKTATEFVSRYRIFRENMKKVKVLQKNEQGTAKYGATQFADLTADEFKKKYLGFRPELKEKNVVPFLKKAEIPNIELPKEFDWRDHGAVTPVKNQGTCGSCWAFSVTGNIEGQWFLNRGKLLSLSEQELVDCDKLDGGCNGGYMTNAYKAIKELGGLETEKDYPYDARNEKCHLDKSEVRAIVTGGLNISSNEVEMAKWLVKNGPISIALNANAMQFYFGGVSHPLKFLCNPDNLDHGVLIVGFGVHKTSILHRTLPYWLIKNSWGPHWGEKGYYRIYRGDGTCGLNQMASSAIVG